MNDRTTIHISKPTKEERALLRLLSPAERLAALVEAARKKAAALGGGTPTAHPAHDASAAAPLPPQQDAANDR